MYVPVVTYIYYLIAIGNKIVNPKDKRCSTHDDVKEEGKDVSCCASCCVALESMDYSLLPSTPTLRDRPTLLQVMSYEFLSI